MGEQVDAESVLGLMRSYFDVARSALERHGGTVEWVINPGETRWNPGVTGQETIDGVLNDMDAAWKQGPG
jgi:hypothetical protein